MNEGEHTGKDDETKKLNDTDLENSDTKEECEKSEFSVSEKPAKGHGLSFNRLLSDKRLWHKCLHTGCVALAFMASGWRMSMVGPSLPEIRLIINADLSKVSLVVSALAFGGLVGCLAAGILYDRLNKCLVFAVLTFLLAVGSVATPWCSTLPSMIAIHAVNGMCTYGIDTVTVADVGLTWRHKNAPVMQAANFAYSLGAMISPLSTEPFFAERRRTWLTESKTTLESSQPNATYAPNVTYGSSATYGSNATYEPNETYGWTYGQTRIHYAYMIAGAISFLACVAMIVQFCILGNFHVRYKEDTTQHDPEKGHLILMYPLSRKWKIVFVAMLSALLCLYCTCERLFYSYLMEFVLARFYFDKTWGANLTTTFWVAFTVGRLLSVMVVRMLKPVLVFAIFLGILASGEVVMLIAANYSIRSLVWVSCGLYGLGMSALCGSIISWVSTNVCPMTGKVSSAMLITLIVGAMVYPLIIGNIMSTYSYDWFVYLAMILTGLMAALVTLLEVLYRNLTLSVPN